MQYLVIYKPIKIHLKNLPQFEGELLPGKYKVINDGANNIDSEGYYNFIVEIDGFESGEFSIRDYDTEDGVFNGPFEFIEE